MITHWKNNTPPAPPFYAVVFISRKGNQLEGYAEMDEHLMQEVQQQAGFLGYSSKGSPEEGIFISYWKDEESIAAWRSYDQHKVAKQKAYAQWYDYFHSMICKVESSVIFDRLMSQSAEE